MTTEDIVTIKEDKAARVLCTYHCNFEIPKGVRKAIEKVEGVECLSGRIWRYNVAVQRGDSFVWPKIHEEIIEILTGVEEKQK